MSIIPILCTVLLQVAPQPPDPPSSSLLRRATAVYAIAGALDVASTAAFVLRGGHEKNPLLAPMQDKPALMLTVGIATSVTSVWAWNRFVGRKHPRIAAIGLYAAAGVHTFLAARNFNQHMNRVRVRDSWMREPAMFSVGQTVSWK